MQPHVTAGIIIIGNEILSGRTRDANLAYLGKRLAELGIELQRACVIPDAEAVIINTVNQYCREFSYAFTTGGIGPTHDDITSAAIAKAFHVPLEKHPVAAASLEAYYPSGALNEARMKMALIPAGASLIRNPVSAAPGFQLENVFVLPGVPLILQVMFEGITDRLTGGPPILSANIATNLREGDFATALEKVQLQCPEVVIGSYPYFKQGRLGVNLVLRSRDKAKLELASATVKTMIAELKGRIMEESQD